MIPIDKVKDLISKHKTIEQELSSGNLDKKNFAYKSKEYSELDEIISEAKKFVSFENSKKELEKIISDNSNDDEMKKMANEELNELLKNNLEYEKKIKLFLLPKDQADTKNAIIEIRAGTGGLEASL